MVWTRAGNLINVAGCLHKGNATPYDLIEGSHASLTALYANVNEENMRRMGAAYALT